MAKRKPEFRIRSYGIYSRWESDSKSLPKIAEFTERVYAELDVEFGLIINIKYAKNRELDYCIYHPDIPDDSGKVRPPFDGSVYIKKNDWDFYLGDTIWEPVGNKLGNWRMTIELDGEMIADKTFVLHCDEE